jgi:hypothetical protein
MDPDLKDPYFFRPPGSGSFHHRAKIYKKNLDFNFLGTSYDFISLKIDINAPSKSNKQNQLFFVGILEVTGEKSRILIRICKSMVW